MIDHDDDGTEPTVRTGNGWRQTTPKAKNQQRCYEDTAPGDDRFPQTDIKFTSVTEALRTGWPSDWTGPTKANIAKAVWENAEAIAAWRREYDEAVRDVADD